METIAKWRDHVATKEDLEKLRAELQAQMQALELRLTLRLGAMVVAGVAVIAVLTRI